MSPGYSHLCGCGRHMVKQNAVVDVQALMGDATDNVPGAPGIGRATAAKLINRWGSLNALMISALTGYRDHVLTPRIAAIILSNWKQIQVSRQLVTLCDRVPVHEVIGRDEDPVATRSRSGA